MINDKDIRTRMTEIEEKTKSTHITYTGRRGEYKGVIIKFDLFYEHAQRTNLIGKTVDSQYERACRIENLDITTRREYDFIYNRSTGIIKKLEKARDKWTKEGHDVGKPKKNDDALGKDQRGVSLGFGDRIR